MTIENEIIYNKELDLNRINQEPVPLQEKEIIDKKSDLHISIKMVDDDDTTLLLIEAAPFCIDDCEPNKNVQGCYIRRFEYVKGIFSVPYSSLLEKFIKSFITRVRFNMIPTADGKFITNYQYVWAEKSVDVKCIIATLLGLPLILTIDRVAIYKENLPQ